jgi:cytochrome P450
MPSAVIDFTKPEVIADPFPALATLLRDDPVHWNPSLGGWCLTRYTDVTAAFIDKSFSSDRVRPFLEQASLLPAHERDELRRVIALWLVFIDPPDHTRLRKLVSHGFTRRAIRKLERSIAEIAHGLVDGIIARNRGHGTIQTRGEFDLIADFAYPLPATVIADILGVPREDVPDLKRWSDEVAAFVLGGRLAPDRYRRSADSARRMRLYFEALIEARRRAPGEAIIDDLIAARDGGDRLSEDELVATCVLLLFAGHETTTQLFGNGMVALLDHPDQLADLVAHHRDKILVENAVEEMLRYDGPTVAMVRVLEQPVEMHGTVMNKGDRVFIFPAAAGRDPRLFENPDRLDIRRPNARRQINFGFGIHLCLGAQLARLEGQTAFPVLLSRLADLKPAGGPPAWNDSLIIRGVKSLPLGFRVGQ